MSYIWRVENNAYIDYIRAASLDKAGEEFYTRHGEQAVKYQVIDHRVFAVYFSGSGSPAYFKGSEKDALEGGRLYIRQWQLDETISRVQEI